MGWEGIEGNTFDLVTGKKLGLTDIFTTGNGTTMELIYDLISEELNNNIIEYEDLGLGNPYWFDNPYEGDGYNIIRERFSPENFYLTHNSLVIFYDKYSLAAGASGPQVLHLPFESIAEKLSNDIKEFLTPTTPAPPDFSFEVKHIYSSWYSFPEGAMLFASCEPIKKELIEGYWTWGYYNNGEIIVYPVGTILSYKWGDNITQFQIRAYDNNQPMSDWVYELILTEEMADRYMLLRWPSYNMDGELLIKVESYKEIDPNISDVDRGMIDGAEENSSGNTNSTTETPNSAIPDSKQGVSINEPVLHPPVSETIKILNENETVDNLYAESEKHSNSINNDDASSVNIFVFFAGLGSGAVVFFGGFLLHVKRKSNKTNKPISE